MKTTIVYLPFVLVSAFSFSKIALAGKTTLVKFYSAAKSALWFNKWDLKSPISIWYTVEIHKSNVTAIVLQNNNIRPTKLEKEVSKFYF
jgi:hypothetical protein